MCEIHGLRKQVSAFRWLVCSGLFSSCHMRMIHLVVLPEIQYVPAQMSLKNWFNLKQKVRYVGANVDKITCLVA